MDGNDPIKRQKTAAGAAGPWGPNTGGCLAFVYIWRLTGLTGYRPGAYYMSAQRLHPRDSSSIAVSATAFATIVATLLFNGDAMIFSAFSSLSGIMPAMA